MPDVAFCIAFLSMVAAIATLAWLEHRRGESTRAWPTVEGTVLRCGAKAAGEGRFIPCVRFAYRVAGKSYVGQRIRTGLPLTSRDQAAASAARYQIGARVTVYYCPQHPAEAVLEPGGFSGEDMATGTA